MKTPRPVLALYAALLITLLFVVPPASASHGGFSPRVQSGTTLKASGQAWADTGAKIALVFYFDPAGGPISGEYDGTHSETDQGMQITYQTHGTLTGTFSGGDAGMFDATSSGETTVTAGGSSSTQTYTASWQGVLYANGTGGGTVTDNVGETATWDVTFDAQAFQSELGMKVPTLAEMPTPDDSVTEVVNVWPPVIEQVVKSWPDLDGAIAEILEQDDAIIALDENGVFYAIDNQGNQKALPPEMQSVLQMNNEFGLLQNANLLWASPAVQAFAAANGNEALDAITGTGTYQYYTIPNWLKQRQYTKVTMSCSGGFCSPVMTYSILHSSFWQPALASSEHSSIRGSINGGGDFIFAPFSGNGVEVASLSLPSGYDVVPGRLQNTGARPYLGVQVLDVVDRADILMVQVNSPADDAGLQVNDAIVSVNGVYVDDQNTLATLIGQYSGGDQVTLGVLLGGSDFTSMDITLATLQPPVLITPSAEITVTDNTEYVIDVGFNGVTGVLVLADWAHVREPVTGSELDVPAGSAVIVVPGYEIGSPIQVGSSDVNVWWTGGQPLPTQAAPTPGPLPPDVDYTWLFLAAGGCFCVLVIIVVVVVVIVLVTRRKKQQSYPPYPGGVR